MGGVPGLAGVAGGCTHEYAGGFTGRAVVDPARLPLGDRLLRRRLRAVRSPGPP